MPNEDIVIIDSSEDEDEPPNKKSKNEPIKEETSVFRISNITSLANVETSSTSTQNSEDVVIIDDDDEIGDSKQKSESTMPKSIVKMIKLKTERINIKEDKVIDNQKTKKIIDKVNDNAINFIDKSETNAVETIEQLMDELKNSIDRSSNSTDENLNENIREESKIIPQEISPEFLNFLDVCVSCDSDKRYRDVMKIKIPKIKQRYLEAIPEFTVSTEFVQLLEKSVKRIERKSNDAVICFNEVYQELGVRKDVGVVLDEKHNLYLKKLNSFLRKISRKISKLENETVDWDADENSSYIQLDRYRKRFCEVHKKICAYTKENVSASRTVYNNLNFDASKYIVLNRAIDRLYNRTKSFPTYQDVDKCVRQCVKEKNVNLIGDQLDTEIRHIFTALGKLLQRRRKMELQVVLTDFLENSSDPALEDSNLNNLLDKQYKAGEEKMEAVLQKFTERQQNGEEPELSSDSGDSYEESDTEENNMIES